MNRRLFLKSMGITPLFHNSLLFSQDIFTSRTSENVLILLELKGGNDGINTLIPYQQKLYRNARPNLAISEKSVLTLNTEVGMHPSLKALAKYWQNGQLAWIQGIGYEKPNRSHFESIAKWDTASLNDETNDGWVAQILHEKEIKGVAIDCSIGPIYTDDLSSIGLIDPLQFTRQSQKIEIRSTAVEKDIPDSLKYVLEVENSVESISNFFLSHLKNNIKPKFEFPHHRLGRDLFALYQLIISGINIPAYKISHGSFDTHVNQLATHEKLLKSLDETLDILIKNLQAIGFGDNIIIMTYSEFGRRLKENANAGTDHGAAAPHFVLGGKVKGGLYGTYPSLENLDERGDLIFTTDFRNMYASVAEKWWKTPQNIGKPILNFL